MTAAELSPLAPYVPGRVQKASLTQDGRIILELYGKSKAWLVLAPTHPTTPVALLTERPDRDENPPGAQRIVRDALASERFMRAELLRPDVVRFHIQTVDERPRTLILERGRDPRLVLLAAKSKDSQMKVLVVVGGDVKTKDGRDLRRGRPYEAPRTVEADLPPLVLAADVTPPRPVPRRDAALQTLRIQLKARHRRFSRLVKALEGDLKRHGNPDALRADGEALKLLLSQAKGDDDTARQFPLPPKGAEDAKVIGFDGQHITVSLDPTFDVVGNIDSLFRRARRAAAGHAHVQPRLDETRKTLAQVEEVRTRLNSPEPTAETREEAAALTSSTSEKGARRLAASAGPRRPYRAFLATGDVVIRIGRSAKDNDTLTFHIAAGNDVWMHAREVAGSHVVFSAPDGEVPTELLIDAAHLAAWFSPLQRDDRIDVQWTRRKYIRKPGKGAPAGFVHVTREKVVHLVVDRARTERILAREVEGEVRTKRSKKRG